MPPKFTISLILLLTTLVTYVRSCELDQMDYGCRIFNVQCNCGYGCKSEYRYPNQDDCKAALRGKADICSRTKPCLHDGSCLQISTPPGFKCSCQGTGFYGARCDRACPGPNNLHLRGSFPYECVVI